MWTMSMHILLTQKICWPYHVIHLHNDHSSISRLTVWEIKQHQIFMLSAWLIKWACFEWISLQDSISMKTTLKCIIIQFTAALAIQWNLSWETSLLRYHKQEYISTRSLQINLQWATTCLERSLVFAPRGGLSPF